MMTKPGDWYEPESEHPVSGIGLWVTWFFAVVFGTAGLATVAFGLYAALQIALWAAR